MSKLAERVSSVEDALRLMERINSSGSDGGKGILESFTELEDKIKAFCDEKFALNTDFDTLKNDL
jgi:hypothetical protein